MTFFSPAATWHPGLQKPSLAGAPDPTTIETPVEKIKEAFEKDWNLIVWNDPINLMTYVVFIFMRVLGFAKEKATKHMLEVHEQGKSCVLTGTREKAEHFHQQLQARGLSVTIEQA